MKSKIRWFGALLALILSLVIGFSFNSNQTEAAKKERSEERRVGKEC